MLDRRIGKLKKLPFGDMLKNFFASYEKPRRGEVHEATILSMTDTDILVDLDGKRDGIVRRDLKNPSGGVLCYQGIPIGQTLARKGAAPLGHLGRVLKHDFVALGVDFGDPSICKEHVTVGQHPAVVYVLARISPEDLACLVHETHAARAGG